MRISSPPYWSSPQPVYLFKRLSRKSWPFFTEILNEQLYKTCYRVKYFLNSFTLALPWHWLFHYKSDASIVHHSHPRSGFFLKLKHWKAEALPRLEVSLWLFYPCATIQPEEAIWNKEVILVSGIKTKEEAFLFRRTSCSKSNFPNQWWLQCQTMRWF